MIDGRLNFDTKIDTRGFSKGLNTLGSQMKGLQNMAVKLAGVLAGAFSVKQVIEYAAEVKALNSQFEQTFGSLQDEAQAAINKVSESSQILDTRLRSTASSIYAFAKANGMDSQTALTMMGDALEVTADSAAYYDRSLEETGETLKSFLKGNYANDAALGISCTETTRNIAANKLYGKSFKDLSEAQKQLTLLQMVKDANAASGALGQAAREAEGWENVIGNLKEAWKQLLAVIGQPILAAIVPVIKNITSALQKLTTIAQAAANAIAAVFGLELKTADSAGALADSTSEISDNLSDITDTAEDGTTAVRELADTAEQAADSYTDLAESANTADAVDISTSSADALADSAGSAAESYSDMEDSAKAAAKANKGSLASFDKINKLSENTAENTAVSTQPQNVRTPENTVTETADPRTGKDNDKTASQAKDTAKAADKAADAAKKTSNAAIELVDKLSGKSSLEKKLTDIISSVKTLLSELFAPLESAWDKYGQGAVDSMERAFTNVWELVKSIGKSFIEVWTNGTGEEMVGHILGIFTQVNTYIANLAENFRKAWSADNIGTDIIQHAADIFNTILSHIENIAAAWADWAGEVNYSPLLTAFDKLEQAVKPIVDDLGEWFEDINNDLLIPLSTWTVETLIPTVLDSLAAALEGLHAAWKTAYPIIKEKLWDGFLQPLAKWAGKTAVGLIKDLGDGLKELGESMTENDVRVLIDLAETIGAIVLACKGAAFVKGFGAALSGLAPAISGLGATLAPAFAEIGTAGGVAVSAAFLPAVIAGIVGYGIGTMIYDVIGEEIDEVLHPLFDKVVTAAEVLCGGFAEAVGNDIPDAIAAIFDPIKNFFTETIPQWWDTLQSDTLFPIYDKASAAWEAVKAFFTESIPQFFCETVPGFFSDSWERIKEIFSLANISKHFTNIVNKIKSAFGKIGAFFKDKFGAAWDIVTSIFSLDNAKTLFSNVATKMAEGFSYIVGLIKDPINGVIDVFNFLMDAISSGFNAVTGVIESMVNSVADTVNALSFDIPDWAGGGTLGFDMPHVSIPDISIPHLPRLASGTVVPANYGEFAAVLGDNRREPEVVSPLGTIRQALTEALRESGMSGGDIYIYLDGEELSYSLERRAGRRSKRTGGA